MESYNTLVPSGFETLVRFCVATQLAEDPQHTGLAHRVEVVIISH